MNYSIGITSKNRARNSNGNEWNGEHARAARWSQLLCFGAFVTGWWVTGVAAADPVVTFASTGLNVTSSGTGAEILNTGTLVEANHYGQSGLTTITLANGLIFGTSTASLIRPNGPNFQAEWEFNGSQTYQTGWGHNSSNDRGYSITDAAFDNLMDHAWWIAYSGSRSDMVINGLAIGHTYRLQLISEDPQGGTVSVEGCPPHTWSGGNSVLSATWTAEDPTMNMQLSRKVDNRSTGAGQGGEVFFNGYALHDTTPPGSLKNITSFTFPGLGDATITGTEIALGVPWGTAVTHLSPTFTLSPDATADPVSGTVRNFSAPQTYVVTAPDRSIKNYLVTVTILPTSAAKDILACEFGVLGAAEIAGSNITITVPIGTVVTDLAPTFTISPMATLNPTSGSTLDFTNPQTYTVTAQNGSTKDYTVAVRSYESWLHSGSLFILTTPEGADLPPSAAEANFPLLVRLNSDNFDFGQAQPGGRDIRFTTATGSTLPYQIEQWDAINGTAGIWVRIPVITGNAQQEIKMYWGKADASAEADPSAVFNATNGFASVIHMNELLEDELGTVAPVNAGTTPVEGLIGKGRHFVTGTGINCGNSITDYPYSNNPFTSECWFRAEAAGAPILYWGRYAQRYNGNTGDGNEVNINIGSPASLSWASDGPGGAVAATVPATGEWYHVAATYSGGVSRIYVNGQLDGTRTGGSTAMSIMQDVQMSIGGWRGGNYGFAGDIDEVRVSRVARSADWMKLQYANQKTLQTLVGPLVQTGAAFSADPAAVTMNEGTTTTLTGQAGGAQKIYWIRKENGLETVIAVDRFTLGFPAGRVTGSQSFVLEFKAVYPTEIKTIDVPVTITESIPDPEFTLTAPATWDGRQTITVTPDISNWSALQAAGGSDLTYTWRVAGVAVSKEITPGTLTLLRSQGSGPMTVTLTMENGGALVTATKTITVREPASDAWVQRVPGGAEKPVNNQFFARDDTGFGTIYYNGTQGDSPDEVFLKVYRTETGTDVLYATHRQSLVGTAYAFAAPVAPGLVTYKVVFGSTTGGIDTVLATVTNLVCGDAYIIQGQSNAVADNPDNPFSSEWIRSFGNLTGGTGSGWGNAVRGSVSGDAWRIGYWGMDLAIELLAAYQVPVCILNGAVGGTRIDQHQRNEANHEDPATIYGRLLTRVAAARLTHGIRGILWHQGENNSGAAAPTGDWDYKSYQQYFVDLSAAWKQDYPNVRHYYVFQVWPLPCGMGPKGDQLREAQRTLPRLFSNMSVISTVGVSGGRGLCHFDSLGYEQIANLTAPLVMRDNYGLVPASAITAPDLKRAYFTTTDRNAIALEFGQDMAWNNAATANFYLDRVAGKVTSGRASGKVITLQLNGTSANETIDYVVDQDWNGSSTNLLRGANGIAALTFAEVPIAALPPSPFSVWAADPAQRLTAGVNDGTLDDPELDGLVNLLEFVLGGHPLAPSSATLPTVSLPGGGTWFFEYERSDLSLPPATTQVVEYGSDLLGWTPVPIPATSNGSVTITPGSPSDHVSVAIPDMGATGFVRLKVTE